MTIRKNDLMTIDDPRWKLSFLGWLKGYRIASSEGALNSHLRYLWKEHSPYAPRIEVLFPRNSGDRWAVRMGEFS